MNPSNNSLLNGSFLYKATALVLGAVVNFLHGCMDCLGAPALVRQLRVENDYLKKEIERLRADGLDIRDRLFEKNQVRPIQEQAPLSPAVQGKGFVDGWVEQERARAQRELAELEQMASIDPENFGPIYQDALNEYYA